LLGKNDPRNERCHGDEQKRTVTDFVALMNEFMPLQGAAEHLFEKPADKGSNVRKNGKKAIHSLRNEVLSFPVAVHFVEFKRSCRAG
jgi:hypothetical protein